MLIDNNEVDDFFDNLRAKAENEVMQLGVQSKLSVEDEAEGMRSAMNSLAQVELQREVNYLGAHPRMKEFLPMVVYFEHTERANRVQLSKNTYRKICGEGLEDCDGEEITNFEICNLCLVVRFDQPEQQHYRFTIKLHTGAMREMCMDVQEFREGNWADGIHDAVCKNKQLFREFCRDCCGTAALKTCYQSKTVGWIREPDGFRQYFVTKAGEITGTLKDIQPLEEGAEIVPSAHLDEREVAERFWRMRHLTKSPVALILLVYTVLASLYAVFKEAVDAPKFLLALVGEASAGKTSLAMAIANLYQRSQRTEPENSLRSTITSIEENLVHYKDAVMIVDDLYPASEKSQQRVLENTLEKVVRMFGDAASKKRSKGFENYETQGMALLTGEYMTGATSSLSRCMILNLERGDLDFALLTQYQQEDKMIPAYFMWNFLKFCSAENVQKTMRTWIRGNIEEQRREFMPMFMKSRTANIAAFLSTTMGILAEYFYGQQVILMDQREALCRNFDTVICEILLRNEIAMEQQNPAKLVLRSLSRLFEGEEVFIADGENTKERNDYYSYQGCIFAYSETLVAAIKRKLTTQNSVIEPDEALVKKVLISEKILLQTSEGGKMRNGTKLPFSRRVKDQRRFWKLSIKRLKEMAEQEAE